MKDLGKIKERYDYSFDTRQLGLVIFGIAAVAALIFVLGVSVGIQWQKKRQPEAVAPPQVKVQAAKVQAKAVPAAPPVLKPVTTSKASFAPVTATPPKNSRVVSLTFPKVLTSSEKKAAAPLEEKKESKKAQGHYAIQLGAYKEASAAKARVDKLKKKGYDARVYAASGRKGGYNYKVHVGSFDTKEDAAAEAKKLSASEGAAPYVTKE